MSTIEKIRRPENPFKKRKARREKTTRDHRTRTHRENDGTDIAATRTGR